MFYIFFFFIIFNGLWLLLEIDPKNILKISVKSCFTMTKINIGKNKTNNVDAKK